MRRMHARAGRRENHADEQSLPNEVVEFLGMPRARRRLSNPARKSPKYRHLVYFARSSHLTTEKYQDETYLLDTFRVHFGIDQVTHNALPGSNNPPLPNTTKRMLQPVKTAMKDNVITADEHAILKTLRGTLDITDAEHEQIATNGRTTEVKTMGMHFYQEANLHDTLSELNATPSDETGKTCSSVMS